MQNRKRFKQFFVHAKDWYKLGKQNIQNLLNHTMASIKVRTRGHYYDQTTAKMQELDNKFFQVSNLTIRTVQLNMCVYTRFIFTINNEYIYCLFSLFFSQRSQYVPVFVLFVHHYVNLFHLASPTQEHVRYYTEVMIFQETWRCPIMCMVEVGTNIIYPWQLCWTHKNIV